jgi:hypothetical protein
MKQWMTWACFITGCIAVSLITQKGWIERIIAFLILFVPLSLWGINKIKKYREK